MSTHIALEDGRVLGVTNGTLDVFLELVADHLKRQPQSLTGLAEWLLDQRCEVQGPGIGYLDLRELCPGARVQIRDAFLTAHAAFLAVASTELLRSQFATLAAMWHSIARGEPPEALTSTFWLMSPQAREQRGPGW